MDTRTSAINEEMKLAAVMALADLAKQPVPEVVSLAYGGKRMSFGREYIIPTAFDPRLLETVAPAVAKAAMDSGVARRPIQDWNAYRDELRKRMGMDNKLINSLTEKAKTAPKKVVFTEANNVNMLASAD